jgi:hypothetical protein
MTRHRHLTHLVPLLAFLATGFSNDRVWSGEPGPPPPATGVEPPGDLPAAATPAVYGFSVPEPAPPLPPGMDAFEPPRLGGPDAPGVAEFTRSAGPDEVVTL